jgi:hypothetical protein
VRLEGRARRAPHVKDQLPSHFEIVVIEELVERRESASREKKRRSRNSVEVRAQEYLVKIGISI